MDLSLGAWRGLQTCSSRSGTFVILALDHRQNLRRMFRRDDGVDAPYAHLSQFKVDVVRALAEGTSAVLLDPEIALPASVTEAPLPGTSGLVLALEATGYLGPPTARRSKLLDDWGPAQARAAGASAAKLLVYHHAAASTAEVQQRFVGDVADRCHEQGLALFLETLTYDPTGGAHLAQERRRSAVIDTARALSPLGATILKVEFPYGPDVQDEHRWREACEELTAASAIPWILLSGGVDQDVFERQVAVACAAGASGVAAGRSIWGEAVAMTGDARRSFLEGAARPRMLRLAEIVEASARPWQRHGSLRPPTASGQWHGPA